MFLFGHLGIGERLGRLFTKPGTRAALLLGCLLPDLVDKPLYYGLVFATGKHAAELGLISGSRTVGHTLLFALLCGALVRGPRGRALFAGMVSHLLLDLSGDLFGPRLSSWPRRARSRVRPVHARGRALSTPRPTSPSARSTR